MPRNVTVTFQNGTTHTYNNVPDNVTPDQIEQRASRDFPRMRATNISGGRKPSAPLKQEKPGRAASFVKGVLGGASDVIMAPVEALVELGAKAGVPTLAEGAKKGREGKADAARRQEAYRQANPNYFTAGQILGETAASAPLISAGGGVIAAGGGRVAQAAPRVGKVIQNVGRAVQTGGVGAGRTAQATAKMTKVARAGELAQRMAGGAIAGGAGSALTGQDVGEGALFGAGLPVISSVLKRVVGRTVDLTKLPRQKAAQIIREALGSNEDAARQVFSQLAPNDQRLARQVLVDAGVEPRIFMGLGADVERLKPDEVGRVLQNQATARSARLAAAGGGETGTARRAAAEVARQGVSEATGPIRDVALQRANVAGIVVPEAEKLAAMARQQAAQQSGFARRMVFGADRAETALGQMDDLGDAFNPAAINRQRGLAGSMTQRGEAAAQQAIDLRRRAQDMEDVVADLAAKGMQPLRVAPIVNQLRSMAAAPGTRADKLQRSTLVKLAGELEGLADANGVIDARDLYQIRKTGLNDIVDRLLGSRAQPSSGTKERTASLLTSIRPMIDNAIETAGGTDWKDYLTRTRQGFEAVNRQELAATGAKLAEERPDEFIALMRGDRPKIVEDIMGPGTKQYDIAGMALADPNRYVALQQSAKELNTLNRMAELGREGSYAASELAYRERPSILTRGVTGMALFPSAPARIAAQGAEMATAGYLAPRVQNELAQGFMSGQNAMALMNQYPTSLGISENISRLSPQTRNFIAQLMRNIYVSPAQ